MHELLENRHEVQVLRAEQAVLEQRRRQFLERQTAERERHEAERRDHAAAVDAATLAGEQPPPAPTQEAGGDYMVFEREAARLRDVERQVLGAVALPVLSALEAREAVLLNDAGKLLAELAPTVTELSSLVETARALPVDGRRLADRVDLDALVAAARTGGSFLRVEDVPEPAVVRRVAR